MWRPLRVDFSHALRPQNRTFFMLEFRSMSQLTATSSADVRSLLLACPFLRGRIDLSGPYAAMGSTALLRGELSDGEVDQVFGVFNDLAERGDTDLDLLATGALELLNDDARTQRLARQKLTGKALLMLEELRIGWGQPDYGK